MSRTLSIVACLSILLLWQATPAFAAGLDRGDTAWMLTSTALVLMMTIPGLAMFYAGMVRKMNVLATMAQSFGVPTRSIITKIILPGSMPAILSGFRITTSTAIILLVAAEMIGADKGIGAFVLQAGNLYDTDNLLAGIVVLSLLGLTVAWLLGMLERVILRWR